MRTRWLLLVLGGTFLLLTPGERIRYGVPLTWEGVEVAVEHLTRLIAVLFAVAWLLASCSLSRIVSGLYGIALAMGMPTLQRAVVRLALVLQYVERDGKGNWRRLLRDDGRETDGAFVPQTTLVIRHAPLSVGDYCFALTGGVLALLVWFV